jgi:hypothetical protein
MKRILQALAPLAFAVVALSARADGEGKCPAIPKEEWKPHPELVKKLEQDGWKVRRVEKTPKCYEVYATDPQGKRVEAFFNPKTFERVEKH